MNGRICAGWVACHDMAESLALRLALGGGYLTPQDADTLLDYTTTTPVFPTGAAAATHGKADIEAPTPRADRAMDKILTRRRRLNRSEDDH